MLSPKQISTICLSFSLILISTKSFSENLSDNPTCDNSTLGVYSGSAALEPDWGANKIPIRWYNNNTLMDVTTAESTCDYDGSIDVPDSPSRTGYNFTGWTIRPQMDFSTLLSTLTFSDTQECWAVGEDYNTGARYCLHAVHTNNSVHKNCSSRAEYIDLEKNEWKTETNQGMVYGVAHCSAKSGNYHNRSWSMDYKSDWGANISDLDSVSGDKNYCWCQVTGFKPTNSSTMYASGISLTWVFSYAYGTPSTCYNRCANSCPQDFRSYSGFRAALFAPATNN